MKKIMKIDPMNSHNDLGCKTVARIHCQNEYSYINKFNYCINALITFSRTLINHLDQKCQNLFSIYMFNMFD